MRCAQASSVDAPSVTTSKARSGGNFTLYLQQIWILIVILLTPMDAGIHGNKRDTIDDLKQSDKKG
jgi:hypothetical protein